MRDVPPEEVRRFVERLQALETFLSGNRIALKNHFQERLGKIVLTPSSTSTVSYIASPATWTFSHLVRDPAESDRRRSTEAASVPGDPTRCSIPAGELLACAP
jgi:hypothetical protein